MPPYTEQYHFEKVDADIRHNFVTFYNRIIEYLRKNFVGFDTNPVQYYISFKLKRRYVGQFKFNQREINWEMKIDNISDSHLIHLDKYFDFRIDYFPINRPREEQTKWMTLYIDENDVVDEQKYQLIIEAFKKILS